MSKHHKEKINNKKENLGTLVCFDKNRETELSRCFLHVKLNFHMFYNRKSRHSNSIPELHHE
jgi:hypothetical protein